MLPPSVISMGGAASNLVVARGIGVMPVGQGSFLSPGEYGLLLLSGLLCEHPLLMCAHNVKGTIVFKSSN